MTILNEKEECLTENNQILIKPNEKGKEIGYLSIYPCT